jgi:hypothetical protein
MRDSALMTIFVNHPLYVGLFSSSQYETGVLHLVFFFFFPLSLSHTSNTPLSLSLSCLKHTSLSLSLSFIFLSSFYFVFLANQLDRRVEEFGLINTFVSLAFKVLLESEKYTEKDSYFPLY